jgi:hypothetical protein
MIPDIVVYKGRTVVVPVSLGIDVSTDTFTSQIRRDPSRDSLLVATWTVTFATNGTDGELVLTMDDTITSAITVSSGYMDLKRVTEGEPVPVFESPLAVSFRESITV